MLLCLAPTVAVLISVMRERKTDMVHDISKLSKLLVVWVLVVRTSSPSTDGVWWLYAERLVAQLQELLYRHRVGSRDQRPSSQFIYRKLRISS